jgi:uncharacterized protein (TIGR02594 family)
LIQLIIRLLQALLRAWGRSRLPTPTPGAQNAPTGLSESPKWLDEAQDNIGFRETGVNRGIQHYITAAKCGSLGDPWCAIFVNAMLERNGIRGTRSPAARSFERDADFVKLSGPALGAIVTMWRGSRNSGKGHVFFYTGENSQGVWGIGGNESDGVREVPHDRSRITGYWWPGSQPLPTNTGPVRVGARSGTFSSKET